jgi:hypothetical protein
MRIVVLTACAAASLLAASRACASGRLDLNASAVRLAVSRDGGTALVTYRANGRVRHVLVWGAVNARQPSPASPQVRFRIDWTGGWARYRHTVWQRFGNACRRYDGPPLPDLVAACTAPDGSYWALQQWQPNLPHRGVDPYAAGQADVELDVSHWTGAPAQLEVHADWAFGGEAHNLFGRLTYGGSPVYGFHMRDSYERDLTIDTLDSAYGPGWKRETSIYARNPTGVFCYSFWPTHDSSLPGAPARAAGDGKAYRVTVEGPGVTPNVAVTVADPGEWNPADAAKVRLEEQLKALQLKLSQGDKFCPTQT